MNQELQWWQTDGGDAYVRRNDPTPVEIASRARAWSRIFDGLPERDLVTVLEVGCGPGANLEALSRVSNARLYAVEPNESARSAASDRVPEATVLDGHAGAIPAADGSFDLVFTAGVLIHIHPDRLPDALREIARTSRRWVLAAEYFAPRCEPVVYYGSERIWRNDFGAAYTAACPDLVPVRTGFFWKTDSGFDNVVWWLLEKR